MTDRPILFSAPMIKALLAGTKTQTRRIIKDAPEGFHMDRVGPTGFQWTAPAGAPRIPFTPRIQAGDRLWVRENLKRNPDLWVYSADGAEVGWPARQVLAGKRLDYAPSIHMPKAASRLTLTVTDVRVQRLQDISEEDAIAEGATRIVHEGPPGCGSLDAYHHGQPSMNDAGFIDARASYRDLWDHINGAGAWAANPWVVAYSFTVERRNIDAEG